MLGNLNEEMMVFKLQIDRCNEFPVVNQETTEEVYSIN